MAQDPVVQEEGAEAEAPKSKKKLIIIIAAAVLLIGGGVGGWLMMSGGDEHAEGEEGEHHEVAEVHDPVYVELRTFTLNLNPAEGEKYLQVDITLNASDSAEAGIIEDRMPQVRNRALMILSSKLPSEIADSEGKKILIAELVEAINEPYSEGAEPLHVSDAFFTSFVIQ